MPNHLRLVGTLTALVLSFGLVLPRVLPTNPDDWHTKVEFDSDHTFEGGAYRLLPGGGQRLGEFSQIAVQDPATKLLAGAVDDGMMTFVSRSKVFGFPDYTTVWQDGVDLKIHARLRFGKKDFGVNATRVDGWIEKLSAP